MPIARLFAALLCALPALSWASSSNNPVHSGPPPHEAGEVLDHSQRDSQVEQDLDISEPAPLGFAPRPRLIQPDCPVTWCAKELELTILEQSGSPLVPIVEGGYGMLAVSPGAQLLFTNRGYSRVMVLFSVNGLNPLDGKPALRKSMGYVVPAQGQLKIDSSTLPGGQWFSGQWPTDGYVNINMYRENPRRPISGTNDHEPPAHAMDFLTDSQGNRYWQPPTGFPFRHVNRNLDPAASTYWKYRIEATAQALAPN